MRNTDCENMLIIDAYTVYILLLFTEEDINLYADAERNRRGEV